jgi:hypothetical protein
MRNSSTDSGKPLTPAEKMRRYRAKLRAQGLRPVQIWVPDTSDPAFIAEAQRQMKIISRCREEKEIMEALDATYAEVMENEPDYKWE